MNGCDASQICIADAQVLLMDRIFVAFFYWRLTFLLDREMSLRRVTGVGDRFSAPRFSTIGQQGANFLHVRTKAKWANVLTAGVGAGAAAVGGRSAAHNSSSCAPRDAGRRP